MRVASGDELILVDPWGILQSEDCGKVLQLIMPVSGGSFSMDEDTFEFENMYMSTDMRDCASTSEPTRGMSAVISSMSDVSSILGLAVRQWNGVMGPLNVSEDSEAIANGNIFLLEQLTGYGIPFTDIGSNVSVWPNPESAPHFPLPKLFERSWDAINGQFLHAEKSLTRGRRAYAPGDAELGVSATSPNTPPPIRKVFVTPSEMEVSSLSWWYATSAEHEAGRIPGKASLAKLVVRDTIGSYSGTLLGLEPTQSIDATLCMLQIPKETRVTHPGYEVEGSITQEVYVAPSIEFTLQDDSVITFDAVEIDFDTEPSMNGIGPCAINILDDPDGIEPAINENTVIGLYSTGEGSGTVKLARGVGEIGRFTLKTDNTLDTFRICHTS